MFTIWYCKSLLYSLCWYSPYFSNVFPDGNFIAHNFVRCELFTNFNAENLLGNKCTKVKQLQ